MDKRHTEGQICETILAEYFLRRGYYVFLPLSAHGPADILIIYSETGKITALDAKKDKFRSVTNRPVPHRIHRVRTQIQKDIKVHIAYVNIDTREVHIVPAIKDLKFKKL